MSAARVVVAVVTSAVVLLLLAASSATDVTWHDDEASELRLSWTARPERIEECRPLTEQERQARPLHMRQSFECTGHLATYDLTVTIDGDVRASEVVRGGGARSDRPLHLLRSYQIAPGARHLRLALQRREVVDSTPIPPLDTVAASPGDPNAARAALEARTRHERARAALPPFLLLDTLITFEPSRVVLVTYDHEARKLRTSRRNER